MTRGSDGSRRSQSRRDFVPAIKFKRQRVVSCRGHVDAGQALAKYFRSVKIGDVVV